MQKWEYKFLGFEVLGMHSMFVRDSDLPMDHKIEDQTRTRNVYHLITDYLNQAGEQGWELVGIEATGIRAYLGELVKAVVVCDPGHDLTERDIKRHCTAALASYQVPQIVEFRDSLPRNPAGKVLKRELK